MSVRLYFDFSQPGLIDQVQFSIDGKVLNQPSKGSYEGKRMIYYESALTYQLELKITTRARLDGYLQIFFVNESNNKTFKEVINFREFGNKPTKTLQITLVRLFDDKVVDNFRGRSKERKSGTGSSEKSSLRKKTPEQKPPKEPSIAPDTFEILHDLPDPDLDYFKNRTPVDELLTPVGKETKSLVEVFYATDRNRLKKKKVDYGNKRGITEFGRCIVNVPPQKEKGELPRPPWYYLGFGASEEKYMLIKEIDQLEVGDFFSRLKTKVQGAAEKDAFLFIHGFNVGFTESILRTAQIAHDIGFQGAPIAYSWPSRKSVFKYSADESVATGYSLGDITHLLRIIRKKTGAEKVHLIAHSMGNRFLTEALKVLYTEGSNEKFKFNQIILAAPDIDAHVFIKEIAPKIAQCSERVTMYGSKKDLALLFSGTALHGGIQRAGKINGKIAVVEGIDTIDASNVMTDRLGHGYFAESKELIDDIFDVTKFNKNPKDRNLKEYTQNEKTYWAFW